MERGKRKKDKKAIIALCLVAASCAVLAGCGAKKEETGLLTPQNLVLSDTEILCWDKVKNADFYLRMTKRRVKKRINRWCNFSKTKPSGGVRLPLKWTDKKSKLCLRPDISTICRIIPKTEKSA